MPAPTNIKFQWDKKLESLTITINTTKRHPGKPTPIVASTYGSHLIPLPDGQFSNLKLNLSVHAIEPDADSNTQKLIKLAIQNPKTPPELKPLLHAVSESLNGYPKQLSNSLLDIQRNQPRINESQSARFLPMGKAELAEATAATREGRYGHPQAICEKEGGE